MHRIGLYVFVCAYVAAILSLVLIDMHVVSYAILAGIILSSCIFAKLEHASVWKAAALSLFAILCGVLRLDLTERALPDAFTPLVDQKVVVRGEVILLPDERETGSRLTVQIKNGIEDTDIIAAVPLYPPIHVGDIIEVQGTLKLPESFETDGGRTFAYGDFLSKDGVFAVMQPAYPSVVGKSNDLWPRFLRVLEWVRMILLHLLGETLPEPENSLAAGLLVGGKQGLGIELIDAFTKAGMLQIIVLSGYNVMIVANTLMKALGALPKKISFAVGSGSIACFVLVAGAGSSALRAGLMAFFAITASTFGKQYDVMRAVVASIGILGVWNPLMLVYDPGFQFSFIATLGLIIMVPLISPKLLFLKSALAIELISTTLAAEIALLPFLLWQTGNFSLVSVVANVVAMPAVPAAMAASAIAAALAFPLGLIAPVLPVIAGIPAYVPLAYIIKVATLSASLPFANSIVPAFPFWVVVLSYSALGYFVYFETKRLRLGNGVQPHPS